MKWGSMVKLVMPGLVPGIHVFAAPEQGGNYFPWLTTIFSISSSLNGTSAELPIFVIDPPTIET